MARWIHLRGGEASLAIDTAPGEGLLPRVVHFGADLGAQPDFDAIAATAPKVMWGARLDAPRPPCVLPGLEAGYFGSPAVTPQPGHGWTLERVDATAQEATVVLRSHDATLALDYRMSPQGVASMRARTAGVANALAWLAAGALPLPAWAHEVLSFGGDWAREFVAERQRLATGALLFESRRGRPGHDRFPGLFVGAPAFGENHGDIYAFTLAWSGSHRLMVERLREGGIVVQAGEVESDGICGAYESPWLHATYSGRGLNGAMQTLHAFARAHVVPAPVAARPRPVNYNTWEAVYFAHDEAALKELATRAASFGVERFVLDDGWFKGRDHDRAGLGDWVVDAKKYPHSLAPLIAHVRGLGLEFGLWVEPEMVNPDSDLARAHPDWLRRESAAPQLLQRNQAVLDIAREEVREHLFQALHSLLSVHPISYLKWDMNRDVLGGGHGAYVRALHALIDRLREAHPSSRSRLVRAGAGGATSPCSRGRNAFGFRIPTTHSIASRFSATPTFFCRPKSPASMSDRRRVTSRGGGSASICAHMWRCSGIWGSSSICARSAPRTSRGSRRMSRTTSGSAR